MEALASAAKHTEAILNSQVFEASVLYRQVIDDGEIAKRPAENRRGKLPSIE